jgi:hypothetical protein
LIKFCKESLTSYKAPKVHEISLLLCRAPARENRRAKLETVSWGK